MENGNPVLFCANVLIFGCTDTQSYATWLFAYTDLEVDDGEKTF